MYVCVPEQKQPSLGESLIIAFLQATAAGLGAAFAHDLILGKRKRR
jgi:hypothetical protein